MGQVVLREDVGGVATLTLNRPAKRNALNIEVFQALEGFLHDIAARTGEIGAVVLRGAGSCFCGGADISRPTKAPRHNYQASVIEKLANLPQPTIGAVHGYCVTGGLEVVRRTDVGPACAGDRARSESVPDDDLWAHAAELAATIAEKPTVATQGTVRAIWDSLDMTRSGAQAIGLVYTQLANPAGQKQVDRAIFTKPKWRLR